MRLIDADKLKAHYAWWKNGTEEHNLDEMKELFDTIVNLQPTVEAVPTEFHDKCQQIEIQKRLKLEEDYRSMERTVEKLTKALADAEPIRHGHWVNDFGSPLKCSSCGIVSKANEITLRTDFKFCPNCGAKMDEVAADG